MKGVILAGGLGTRLYPVTKVTNKHLLPVYDRPMIYYPILALVDAGIRDILIVTGGNSAGDFLELLGNGSEFGLQHLNYTYQSGHGGIAEALGLARYFAESDKVCVILGDNIFHDSLKPAVERFAQQPRGAKIVLHAVDDSRRFGVAELRGGKVVAIEEKPARPRSNYAVTGIYFYDTQAFEIIEGLTPSARNELEVTDLNNRYIEMGQMTHEVLEGWWSDAGTFESLRRATNLVAEKAPVWAGRRA